MSKIGMLGGKVQVATRVRQKHSIEIIEKNLVPRGPKVEEPLGLGLEYPILWREPWFNLERC